MDFSRSRHPGHHVGHEVRQANLIRGGSYRTDRTRSVHPQEPRHRGSVVRTFFTAFGGAVLGAALTFGGYHLYLDHVRLGVAENSIQQIAQYLNSRPWAPSVTVVPAPTPSPSPSPTPKK
jgi:hypothetical protein